MALEDDLVADPVGLAKRYSFFPQGKAKNFAFDSDVNAKDLKGDFAGFTRSHVHDDKMISRVTLEIGRCDRGESLLVNPVIGDGAGGVPVYFLPWDQRGAAVRMEIPSLAPDLPVAQHPKIFFTAVLSGCSIIFKGTPQNPTIYHCGTEGLKNQDGGQGTPTPRDSSKYANSDAFFRQMLSGRGYRSVGGQIKKTDYMVPTHGGGGDAIAQRESDFLTALKGQDQFKKGFILKSAVSWGACFGVRNGADWKFYLQENASISYDTVKWVEVSREKEVTKKTLFSSKTTTSHYVTTQKSVTPGKVISRPLLVQRVFPGTGKAKMTSSWDLLQL